MHLVKADFVIAILVGFLQHTCESCKDAHVWGSTLEKNTTALVSGDSMQTVLLLKLHHLCNPTSWQPMESLSYLSLLWLTSTADRVQVSCNPRQLCNTLGRTDQRKLWQTTYLNHCVCFLTFTSAFTQLLLRRSWAVGSTVHPLVCLPCLHTQKIINWKVQWKSQVGAYLDDGVDKAGHLLPWHSHPIPRRGSKVLHCLLFSFNASLILPTLHVWSAVWCMHYGKIWPEHIGHWNISGR